MDGMSTSTTQYLVYWNDIILSGTKRKSYGRDLKRRNTISSNGNFDGNVFPAVELDKKVFLLFLLFLFFLFFSFFFSLCCVVISEAPFDSPKVLGVRMGLCKECRAQGAQDRSG